MTEQRTNTLEPLLIPTLRSLLALPLITISVTLLVDFFWPTLTANIAPPAVVRPSVWPFVIAEFIALCCLIFPALPNKWGRWFLPVTLFFCTLGPPGMLITHLLRFNSGVVGDGGPFAMIGFERVLPAMFFLTIPMIVIAWQYSFRWVLFYVLSLAFVDLSLALYLQITGDAYDIVPLLGKLAVGRTVVYLATGYLVSRLVAGQRQQQAALAQANSQLVQYALTQEQLAVSRERNRLARDLHDTLAHYMSGLVLELEGTRLLWESDSTQARTTLDNAITTARTGLVETRRALQALRSTPLVDLGFNRAVAELAESMAARNQWQLQIDLSATPVVLPTLVEEVLYRIIQEGLTNIERHADATKVTLTLQLVDDALQLVLTDDGSGFAEEVIQTTDKFGLVGMKERSDLIGGSLRIDSAPDRGVSLTLTIPSPQASAIAPQRLSPRYDDRKAAFSV